MNLSSRNLKALRPFLKCAFPSFRIGQWGEYTIMGLLKGNPILVEGVLDRQTPPEGLYCTEMAAIGQLVTTTATPAPPSTNVSFAARSKSDKLAFFIPDPMQDEAAASVKSLKSVTRIDRSDFLQIMPEVGQVPSADGNLLSQIPSVTIGAYDSVVLTVPVTTPQKDAYFVAVALLRLLHNDSAYDAVITEQDVLILESKEFGYYLMAKVHRLDKSNRIQFDRKAAIEELVENLTPLD